MSDEIIINGDFSNFAICKKCENKTGRVVQSSTHKKLICNKCDSYIKFLTEKEMEQIIPIINEDIDNSSNDFSLEYLHFKIDLILDHLNIRFPSKK